MSATPPRPNAFIAPSHTCAPDSYLTDDRLALIFDDFTGEILRFTPSGTVFTHLVNNVRSTYMAHMLEQGQVFADRMAQFELDLASERDRRLAEVAELRGEHERQMSELIARHNNEITRINSEREIERIAPRGWITNIEVFYNTEGGHAPHDRIPEYHCSSNDINSGFGGDWVWLVPRYHNDPTGAITSIEIDIRSNSDGRPDLAKGAGGQFRHLTPKFDHNPCKIHTVNLLRLSNGIGGLPAGFTGHSGDINAGRGGDFLYLIWKAWCV